MFAKNGWQVFSYAESLQHNLLDQEFDGLEIITVLHSDIFFSFRLCLFLLRNISKSCLQVPMEPFKYFLVVLTRCEFFSFYFVLVALTAGLLDVSAVDVRATPRVATLQQLFVVVCPQFGGCKGRSVVLQTVLGTLKRFSLALAVAAFILALAVVVRGGQKNRCFVKDHFWLFYLFSVLHQVMITFVRLHFAVKQSQY